MTRDKATILDNLRSRGRHWLLRRSPHWGLKVAAGLVVLAVVVVACARVLTGPTGDDVTTRGTAAAVILFFLLLAYPLGGLLWSSPKERKERQAGSGQS